MTLTYQIGDPSPFKPILDFRTDPRTAWAPKMPDLLFDKLPEFPPALPNDDVRYLRSLPEWPTEREVSDDDHAVAGRLERKGLIKVSRQKMDPAAHRPTWFAGRLPASMVRAAS